ncbi:MAG: recombinase family protein [Candidatus Pacearchaeota archaeon]|nr:recombinase family protein [Candidatus Pacearchaeota archaeon]
MEQQSFEQLQKENQELREEIQRLRTLRVNQKIGMQKKATIGNHVSRPAFGYKLQNKELIPAENFSEIQEIFEEFLNENITLTNLAKRHNLSINGLKKILKNFTYVGKVKFDGQIHNGKHKPIISSTLFNQVQDKLERLRIK